MLGGCEVYPPSETRRASAASRATCDAVRRAERMEEARLLHRNVRDCEGATRALACASPNGRDGRLNPLEQRSVEAQRVK
ncbi:hypothetical protein SCP_1003210 [Sparassis crispa]|uniref:Uncharacterized protein n=1 Tax=Sparassis crispa TaxID=139825 RepID=A0A401GYI4_9APHY|nr:hypothetical protein SCP_1003210 [Sparassis crispa]GBE87074.1 hypothetical protein SCP_1003210 [Sparassis crispa]